MTAMFPDAVRALAKRYEPVLVFSSGERIFPVQVESYLSHVSAAPWVPGRDLGVEPELPGGPHRRGTAIMDGEPPGVLCGGRSASGAPLGRDGADADAIGNSAYRGRKASPDLFLTFGGWRDSACTRGDADYLIAAFSELAAAMNENRSSPWEEFESLPNRPVLWTTQPTTPTVYAEAAWCGDHLKVSRRVEQALPGEHDLAHDSDATALSRTLALTYHWFFPLQDARRPGPLSRRREGQWVAATVFFEGEPGSSPPEFEPVEPPVAIALSREPGQAPDVASFRPWSQTVRDDAHPRLHVSHGRHLLLFAAPDDPEGNLPAPVGGGAAEVTRLSTHDLGQSNFPGAEVLLAGGLLLPAPFAEIVFLLWLLSVLIELVNNDPNNGPDGPPVEIQTPAGDGAGPIATPAGVAQPGEVLSSGRRVDDPPVSLLRVIDALPRDPRQTVWPDEENPGSPPPRTEYPYWWDFAGRWGVAVAPHSMQWASGTRRVDGWGRSLGYRNTVQLARAWALGLVRRPSES